jgi:hypothetical protein
MPSRKTGASSARIHNSTNRGNRHGCRPCSTPVDGQEGTQLPERVQELRHTSERHIHRRTDQCEGTHGPLPRLTTKTGIISKSRPVLGRDGQAFTPSRPLFDRGLRAMARMRRFGFKWFLSCGAHYLRFTIQAQSG